MGEKIERVRGIVLASGEILDYPSLARLIGPTDFIVCADAGYNHCKPLGVVPDMLVGDFDSLKIIPPDISKVELPTDKNYTDTTFAVEAAIHNGCNEIILAGMLGGRLDHTLANLQSLVYCTNQGINATITDGRTQVFCMVADGEKPLTATIAPVENYYFSLLSYSQQCRGVSITGGKYTLTDHTLTFDLARAVSNEFTHQPVTIEMQEGTLLFLLVPKEEK